MKRAPLVALALAAAVAGVWANRTFRERPAAVDPAVTAAAEDRERGFGVLLTGGEQALAKEQLGAAWLAHQAVPEDSKQAARRAALKAACEQVADRRIAGEGLKGDEPRSFWSDVLMVRPHNAEALVRLAYGARSKATGEDAWLKLAACEKGGGDCAGLRDGILSRVNEGRQRIATLDPARPKTPLSWKELAAARRAPQDAAAIEVLEKKLTAWREQRTGLSPDDALGAALMLVAYDPRHPWAHQAADEVLAEGGQALMLGEKLMESKADDARALFAHVLRTAPASSKQHAAAQRYLLLLEAKKP